MLVPMKLVVEFILFSPLFFFFLLILVIVFSLRKNPKKFKKPSKSIFLLKSFAGLWIFLLLASTNLFYQIEQVAGYGFNRSHSFGFTRIVYQTRLLKAHYPVVYMSSVLSCEMDATDRILLLVGDFRSTGLKVLKPDITQCVCTCCDLVSKTMHNV